MADIDYSKLSDEELEALASGDYSKLSDATLQMLAGEKPAAAAKPAAPTPAPVERKRLPLLPRDVRSQTDVSPGRGISGLLGIPGGLLDIATGITGIFGETGASRELREMERRLSEKAPEKGAYEVGKVVPQVIPALGAAKAVSKIPVASRTAQAVLQAAGQAGQAYAVTPSAPETKLSDLVLEKPREEGLFGLGPRGEAALIEGGLGLAGEAVAPLARRGVDFARSARESLTGRIRGVPTTPVTEEEKAALEIAQKRGAADTTELSEAEKAAAEARAEKNRIKAAEAEQKLALEQQRQALLAKKKAAEEAEAKALETVELTPTRGKQELGQRLRDVVTSARQKYMDARNQAIGKFESGQEVPVFTAAKEMEAAGEFISKTDEFKGLVKFLRERGLGRTGKAQLDREEIKAFKNVLRDITPRQRVLEEVVDEAGNVTKRRVSEPVDITFEKLVKLRRRIAAGDPGVAETGFKAITGDTRDKLLEKIDNVLEDFSPGYLDYKKAYAEASEPLDFLKVNSVGKKAATFQKFSQEQFQANPESVLDALLNNPSKTNADNLLKFVGNENKDEVEQVVLEALVNKAGGKASGYTKVLEKYDDFLEAFPTAKARLQEEAGVFEKATAPSRAAFEEATAGLEGVKLARESAKNRVRIANAAFERAEAIRVAAKDRVQALNELDEDTLIAVSEAANKIPLNTSLGLAQAAALAAIAGGAGAIANDSPITGILAIAGGALGRKQVKNAFARKRKEVADRIEEQLRKIVTDRSGARAASIQTRIDNETSIMNAQRLANQALRDLGIKPGIGAVTANTIYKAFATDKGAEAVSGGASEPAGEEGLVPGEEGEAESAVDGQSYDIDSIISERGAEDIAPIIKSIYEQESSSGKAANLDKENYAGAKGPMQVTRDTFDAMRNKGMIPEDYSFDNLSHLAEAGVVLIQDLAKRYDNDPEKIAAAYYGGPKAVTAQGINRNQRDKRNRKAPTVGQYADQVLARLMPTAEAKGMAEGGLVTPGNIDVSKLPAVRNPDGTVSTVRSMSINVDGKEVLIPTVINGRVVSDKEAIDQYMKTGRHLGIFDTPESATTYAQRLHEMEAQRVKKSQGGAAYSPAEELLLRRYADGGPAKRPTLPADRYAGYKQVGESDDRLLRFFEAAARELPDAIKQNVTSNADLAAKYLKFKFGMMSPEEMMTVARALPESLKGAAVAAMQAVKEAPKAVAEATPETAGKFAGQMIAGEMTDPLKLVRGMPKPTMAELDVYHGTPHRFPATEANPLGEFDASKIGTGEGAQAYGHGIYLAEAPGTAEIYKRALAEDVVAVDGNRIAAKRSVDARRDPESIAVNALISAQSGQVDDPFATAMQRLGGKYGPRNEYDAKAIEVIRNWRNKGAKIEEGGVMYKADLPDEMIDRMLDWDKPLSEQPKMVRDAINAIVEAEELYKGKYAPRFLEKDATAGDIVNVLENALGGPKVASSYLRDAGIPGIKYKDAGSRGQPGTGTRNFVVFPGEEKKVRILERK